MKTWRNNFRASTIQSVRIPLAGLLVLIGALIGMWGSVMSIRRFLKV